MRTYSIYALVVALPHVVALARLGAHALESLDCLDCPISSWPWFALLQCLNIQGLFHFNWF